MPENLLKVQDLEKVYNRQTVFSGLNFAIKRGERTFIIGPNGAGKSTLLEILLGLTAPTKGEVFFNGKKRNDIKEEFFKVIFFLSHETFFYYALTALENLEFFLSIFSEKSSPGKLTNIEKSDLIENSLKRVSLYFDRNKKIDELSLGMRHRLAVARFHIWDKLTSSRTERTGKNKSLPGKPVREERILFLDEPYSGLDKSASNMLDDLLDEKSSQGFTIIEATHRLTKVEELWKKCQPAPAAPVAPGSFGKNNKANENLANKSHRSHRVKVLRLTNGKLIDDGLF